MTRRPSSRFTLLPWADSSSVSHSPAEPVYVYTPGAPWAAQPSPYDTMPTW
ncbi:hypothetical protein [Streptomyces cinerochromogenes]|uniref:hypothetical protein n=1 Tax=Streptomyces cinerochromogenes TaxID=66422 RepID=UPI001E3B0ABC|nr:hypothetical protein [Streptomyces cinerochromogenes]